MFILKVLHDESNYLEKYYRECCIVRECQRSTLRASKGHFGECYLKVYDTDNVIPCDTGL